MEFEDMIRDCSHLILHDNQMIGKTFAASQGTKHMVESAQMRSADDLHKFLEQYEQSQKEQAKESRFNRWLSIASLVIAVISMFIAAVK